MKKNYLLLLLITFLSFNQVYAEPCPDAGGTTSAGGTKIIFSYSPATSFCVNRPTTIVVNGVSTFTLEISSCSETISVYNLTSGPAIVGQDFNVTSGFDENCSYSGGTLPIDEFALNSSLDVYPNPLNNDSSIKLSFAFPVKADISIFSITGKKIIQDKISNQDNKEINIANLENGVYILNVSTQNATAIRKIVVAK
ncbi:T9SS type A sorting domain-containing protein [uncultured Wocania sp.]|uniref:T9SS type A sorting domain-containing protein n=1 Tax=uncultured Wocania sp. TaxID=2834404 RepID=UPI0030F56EED